MVQFYTSRPRSANKDTQQPKIIDVEIEDLDQFGQGIAHNKGKTLFIEGGLPGESGQAVITEEKRLYAKGKLIQRSVDSPERVTPRCPYFEQCGGCSLQHASVALQQKSKQAALLYLLQRETGQQIVEAGEVICAAQYGYRRRTRLGLRYDKQRLIMGFRQQHSNQLVSVEQCPVLVAELNKLLQPLYECLSSLQQVKQLGHVELIAADNAPIVILRHLRPLPIQDRETLTLFAQRYQVNLLLLGDRNKLESLFGDQQAWYHLHGLTLHFNPLDFIQVNAEINQRMVTQAISWLELQPDDLVLDLFCGMGNFTLPIAEKVAAVTAVEVSSSALAQAQKNADSNQLQNICFYLEDLTEGVTEQQWINVNINKALLDPARSGALEAMPQLIALRPERIVYISCNPTTLARDSKLLLTSGYKLQQVRMLDMFPQTAHLESMALFVRKEKTG